MSWDGDERRLLLFVVSMILNSPQKNKHSAVTNRAEPGMVGWDTKYVHVVITLQ